MHGADLPDCPLCLSTRVRPFAEAHGRSYFECQSCTLVCLAPEQRLTAAAERMHYGTHENAPSDPGYRAFLSRLSAPLVRHLSVGAEGLDYGSGPGPTLSRMLEEQGFRMTLYDPFFAPDRAGILQRTYDFITCTETAEHFFRPGEEFDRMNRLLRPGGWLGLMTEMLHEEQSLEHWRYARDPTHACFYRRSTIEWIATRLGWSSEFPHRNVVLFRKPLHALSAQLEQV
jgi:SAM-dependent methyltransferase